MSGPAQPNESWLIYGATGYTGRLIAEKAATRGLRPILAGRNRTKVNALADRLGLPWRAFPLDDVRALGEGLSGVRAVLHCAGPFAQTAPPMLEACLGAKVHYLDITGEIEVFERAHALDQRAKAQGVALLPGVGFDVVPSDCLAVLLAKHFPGARSLILAFEGEGGPSPGTAKTALLGLAKGGLIRRGGRLERVPLAWKSRYFVRGGDQRLAVTVPWGDVYTAYLSTGIPDIEVYMVVSPRTAARLRRLRPLAPLLGWGPLNRLLCRRIEKRVHGPSPERREHSHCWLWGEVSDGEGRSLRAALRTPNGYELTAEAALAAVSQLLGNPDPPSGFRTPAQAFGPGFALGLPGVEWLAEWSPSA